MWGGRVSPPFPDIGPPLHRLGGWLHFTPEIVVQFWDHFMISGSSGIFGKCHLDQNEIIRVYSSHGIFFFKTKSAWFITRSAALEASGFRHSDTNASIWS